MLFSSSMTMLQMRDGRRASMSTWVDAADRRDIVNSVVRSGGRVVGATNHGDRLTVVAENDLVRVECKTWTSGPFAKQ
jgi:hypothetical protein